MKPTRYFRFFCALAFPCLWTPTVSAQKAEFSPFKVTVEPLYPLALSQQEITEGMAEFVIAVDNQGTLRDHLLVKASHPLFGEAVEEVLPSWEYRPVLIGGERVNAMHRITVNFRSSGMFVVGFDSVNTIKDSRIKLIGGSRNNTEYSVARLPQLDAPPARLQAVHPNIPDSEEIPAEGLRVVYNFFIDQEGRVRIPWIDEQEFQHIDEEILDATYDALMQWEFTPPTVNGKKVVTQVSQPFWFTSPKHSVVDSR